MEEEKEGKEEDVLDKVERKKSLNDLYVNSEDVQYY